MDIMTIIKYFLLGAIQGFTEPLPISSSAHMIIASHFLKINEVDLDFEIFIHFASFLAILIYFIPDLIHLLKNLRKNQESKIEIINLLIASLPAAIIGLLLKNWINQNFINLKSASFFLIFTSFLLLISSFLIKSASKKNITPLNSIIIGIWQGIALLPGISRSGATIFGGIIQKIDLKRILKFSFLLYLIASFGALLLALFDYTPHNLNSIQILITFISAFIGTSIAIRWLFNIISKRSLQFFSLYTALLGICLLISIL